MSKYKYALGMVSSCKLYRKANGRRCNVWCHCYKDPNAFIGGKPNILLSESDFIDPYGLICHVPSRSPRWNFYYFTIGGSLGIKYKGLDLFAECLPILCGEFNLKGVVIEYARFKRKNYLTNKQRYFIEKYKDKLTFIKAQLTPGRISRIMSESKFGFFPNRDDCSPLLLTESLVRQCPVLVNKDILGGWKYINKETGAFFDKNNIGNQLEFILRKQFNHVRDEFMRKYGYKKTAVRLANFMHKHFFASRSFRMIAFHGSRKYMRAFS